MFSFLFGVVCLSLVVIALNVSQPMSGPSGLFSRAEDKLKQSDDVIDGFFT
jgi:hypothetical protein